MADYYSHNDPKRKGSDAYLDYETGRGATWIWAVIVLVAVVALIALGSSGSGPVVEGEAALPATEAAPVPAEPAPAIPTE